MGVMTNVYPCTNPIEFLGIGNSRDWKRHINSNNMKCQFMWFSMCFKWLITAKLNYIWIKKTMTYIELVMYAGSFFVIQNVPDQLPLWDRKRTQWATWGLIRTKKGSFWVGRLKWSHCCSQMVSFWVAVSKLLPLGAKLVSFWMVWNRRVSNRLSWSQLVLFWVAYRKAPPQRAKMASFWMVWFSCG